jgi:hypothetical protein
MQQVLFEAAVLSGFSPSPSGPKNEEFRCHRTLLKGKLAHGATAARPIAQSMFSSICTSFFVKSRRHEWQKDGKLKRWEGVMKGMLLERGERSANAERPLFRDRGPSEWR